MSVQSNHSTNQVRKNTSYFSVAVKTSNFILHFYNALDVSTLNIEVGLVEVKYFL